MQQLVTTTKPSPPPPQTQVPTTEKKKEVKESSLVSKRIEDIRLMCREEIFLLEEMKDQKSWVGVFFLMMKSGKLPFFLYPRRAFQAACCIDCYLECKTEHET